MRAFLDFTWLDGVDATVGAIIVVVLYALMLVAILTRRRSRICGQDEPRSSHRLGRLGDLRIWIVALIAIQVGLHLWLC
jgi:hypothetical protein